MNVKQGKVKKAVKKKIVVYMVCLMMLRQGNEFKKEFQRILVFDSIWCENVWGDWAIKRNRSEVNAEEKFIKTLVNIIDAVVPKSLS